MTENKDKFERMRRSNTDDDNYCTTVSGIVAKSNMNYPEAVKWIVELGSRNIVRNELLIFHTCNKKLSSGAIPFGQGFPQLPWHCPLCDKTAETYSELQFDILVHSGSPLVLTKADKLVDRGLLKPGVAKAAANLSDILTRMCLGQPRNLAEGIEAAFPELQPEEAGNLAILFRKVAQYFEGRRDGDIRVQIDDEYEHLPVRPWTRDSDFYYEIYKVLCVLSCDLPHCGEHFHCWETRPASCIQDYKPKQSQENEQPTEPQIDLP